LSEKTDLKLVVDVLKKFNSSEFKIALVVIDSIRGMQRGSLSDDAVGEVMQDINSAICQGIGATVQYIHHSKKNTDDITAMDALLGSVTIVNSVRHALFIRKLSGRVREVEVCKSNLGFEDHFFKATLDDNKRINLEHRGLLDEKDDETDPSQIDKAEEIILSMIGGGDWGAAYEIYRRGEMEEISVETIKRAKKLYDIEVKKRGKIWMWRLKPQKEEGQGEGEGLTPLTPLRVKQPELFDKEEGQEGGQASEG